MSIDRSNSLSSTAAFWRELAVIPVKEALRLAISLNLHSQDSTGKGRKAIRRMFREKQERDRRALARVRIHSLPLALPSE